MNLIKSDSFVCSNVPCICYDCCFVCMSHLYQILWIIFQKLNRIVSMTRWYSFQRSSNATIPSVIGRDANFIKIFICFHLIRLILHTSASSFSKRPRIFGARSTWKILKNFIDNDSIRARKTVVCMSKRFNRFAWRLHGILLWQRRSRRDYK